MKKPGLKDFLEAKRRLLDHRIFDSIRHRLHAETLWQLNKRSLANGLAVGLFAAFIPLPLQMLIAASLAIAVQGNMPVALVCTWISNPFTYPPLFYINYKIGTFVLEFFHPIQEVVMDELQDKSIFMKLGDFGVPFLIGSVCFAVLSGIVGYISVRAIWRVMTLYKIHRRRRIRRSKQSSI